MVFSFLNNCPFLLSYPNNVSKISTAELVISAMNFKQEDEKLLKVWQTFQFKFNDATKPASERADAARSLMFQVEKFYDR